MAKHIETTPSMESHIGIDEAAALLCLKRATVYALTSRRSIPHYKRGGRLYFKRSELLEWIAAGQRRVVDESTAREHMRTPRDGGKP